MPKPLSGVLWGILLGLAVAVVLQQQGLWPLDKLTVFLLPGLIGLIGVIITSLGRTGSGTALTVALVIAVPMAAYGATGFADIDEQGVLNGGCTVEAVSDVDATTVVDSSKRDPFVIDPHGGLSWLAHSPSVFDDYPWEIWVEFGGAQIPLDSEESQDNDGGSQDNFGEEPNIQEYGEARGLPVSEMRGVYKVGGFASICNGHGFVKLLAEPLETILAKVFAAIALLSLIMLLRAALMGRGVASAALADPGTGSGPEGQPAGDLDGDGDVDGDDYRRFTEGSESRPGGPGVPPGDQDGGGDAYGPGDGSTDSDDRF